MRSNVETSVASGVTRMGDSGDQAGYVDEIAAIRHRDHQVVTAVRTQSADLRLIAWDVSSAGAITRTGDSGTQAGHATFIDIAGHVSGNRLVTSCQDSDGSLKLISWDVSDNGSTITRLGDSGNQAGAVTETSIITVDPGRLVTAVRTDGGNLKLIGWRLNADGSLTRLADSGDQGSVGDIAPSLMNDGTLVTSVRAFGGSLKLISWAVSDTAITRLADSGSQAGAATRIRSVVDGQGHLITAVRTEAGDLRLITWQVSSNGTVTRLASSGTLAGETVGHDISLAAGRIITGVRTTGSALKVIMWQTDINGAVTRAGDSADAAGSIEFVVQCAELAAAPPIVTCVKTSGGGNLKLISWSPAA